MFPKDILYLIYSYGGESDDFYRHLYDHNVKRIKYLPNHNFKNNFFSGFVCALDTNFYYFTNQNIKYKKEVHIGKSDDVKYAVCKRCLNYKMYYNFTNATKKNVKLSKICINCRDGIRHKIKNTKEELGHLTYIVDEYETIYNMKIRINILENDLRDLETELKC